MVRIYITGKPAGGKTTIAHNIQSRLDIPVFHSDFVLFKHLAGHKKRRKATNEELKNTLGEILRLDSWIYEGKHLLPEVIKKSNVILHIKEPLVIILFRQWKRYFTDKTQRELYGFKNNISFSRNIFKMYISKEDVSEFDNIWYYHEDKLLKIANTYKIRVIEVTPSNRKETENIIEDLVKPRTLL